MSATKLELTVAQGLECADFSLADSCSVRVLSVLEAISHYREQAREPCFQGDHEPPPKIRDGQQFLESVPEARFEGGRVGATHRRKALAGSGREIGGATTGPAAWRLNLLGLHRVATGQSEKTRAYHRFPDMSRPGNRWVSPTLREGLPTLLGQTLRQIPAPCPT